jgi:Zn-dependent alcohol dehydrogenase
MSLWGNKDSLSNLTGTISIDLNTGVVTGSGTTFITAGISTGDILYVGAGGTFGQAVISGITSATVISVGSTQFLIPNAGSGIVGAAYTVTQKPKYTLEDGQYGTPDAKPGRWSATVGVSTAEIGIANTATGDARKYAPAHAGWVGVTTYNDMHGNYRVKTETLVAGSMIDGDAAADDDKYPNA